MHLSAGLVQTGGSFFTHVGGMTAATNPVCSCLHFGNASSVMQPSLPARKKRPLPYLFQHNPTSPYVTQAVASVTYSRSALLSVLLVKAHCCVSHLQDLEEVLGTGWIHPLNASQKAAARCAVANGSYDVEHICVIRALVCDGLIERRLHLCSRSMAPPLNIALSEIPGLFAYAVQPQLCPPGHISMEPKAHIIETAVASVAAIPFSDFQKSQRIVRIVVVGAASKGWSTQAAFGPQGTLLKYLIRNEYSLQAIDTKLAAYVQDTTLTARFMITTFKTKIVEALWSGKLGHSAKVSGALSDPSKPT